MKNKSLILYVKAGCDNKKYGACPCCQRIFMMLIIRSNQEQLKFRVATVPTGKFPKELKNNGLCNLPALIHNRVAIDTVEEIAEHIEKQFPTSISSNSTLSDKVTRESYTELQSELKKLDNHLKESIGASRSFISGSEIGNLDCEILPKLHHVRICALYLKGYSVPVEFTGIWAYLHLGYSSAEFRLSCPSDQEIILHWALRPDTPSLSNEELRALTKPLQKPRYTFDVPATAVPIIF